MFTLGQHDNRYLGDEQQQLRVSINVLFTEFNFQQKVFFDVVTLAGGWNVMALTMKYNWIDLNRIQTHLNSL